MAIGLNIVDKDFVILEDGTVDVISGIKKCARDFNKMLLTESVNFDLDPNNSRYNPYFGTQLRSPNLLKGLSKSAIIDTLTSTMNTSIKYYIKLQEQRQNLSLDEVIQDVQYITYQDPTNAQKMIISIRITTGSGNTFAASSII